MPERPEKWWRRRRAVAPARQRAGTIVTNHGRELPVTLTRSTRCHPCCGGVKGSGRPDAGHEVGCVDYANRVAGSGAFDA